MHGTQSQIFRARKLRREQTDVERLLWFRLRKKQINGVKFRRQDPIGPYIVDFVTYDKNVIIELDGGQHNDDEHKKRDSVRTDYLRQKGYIVLRFWNNEILENLDGVLEKIHEVVAPTPTLPLRGREL
jgi:very-short-patch-repair endonuclease